MTLEQQTGLTAKDFELIRQAARRQQTIETLVLFGSRAKGTFRRGSDVDLAVQGANLDNETLHQFADQLNQELPLPYFFDVLNYNDVTDPSLKEHLHRVGLVIYQQDATH